jgi:hypothetical protein
VAHERRQHDEKGRTAHREEPPDAKQACEDPAPSEAAEAVDGVQGGMAQVREKTGTCAFIIAASHGRGSTVPVLHDRFLE